MAFTSEQGRKKDEKKDRSHKPRQPCLNNLARSHLLRVAGGLGGGGLGLGGNNSLLVKTLEERPDDGTISDLSTLEKADQSRFGSNQKRKAHTRKAGSWSQRMKRDLKAKYHGR